METKSVGSSGSDASIIRRQLLWMLAALALCGAAWGVAWWGQDTGWGDPARAVSERMDLGEKDLVAGRVEDAARQYQSVVDRYPEDPRASQAMTQLAAVLQQLGRDQDALDVLQKLNSSLQGQPQKADLQAYTELQIGDAKKAVGDYAGALDAYADVRSRHPKTDWAGEAQSGTGDVLRAEGRYKDARAAYAGLVKELPGGFLAAEAQTSIGQCFEEEKNPKAALKAYEVVLRKYPPAVWDTAKARVDALKKQLENPGSDSAS
ncbi:MAG TPA: tetratricopeptide repeat protein [bacterium]|jgi:TolA-binding protein|nr:tetratricopeptide repeat protein [bacterium]